MDFILQLNIYQFLSLYDKAREEEINEKLWQRWLTIYPYMEIGRIKFIAFEDYKKELFSNTTDDDETPVVEIMGNVKNILDSIKNGSELPLPEA